MPPTGAAGEFIAQIEQGHIPIVDSADPTVRWSDKRDHWNIKR
jgi:hypothetical protein